MICNRDKNSMKRRLRIEEYHCMWGFKGGKFRK